MPDHTDRQHHTDRQPNHIVLIGPDDHETSTVGRAFARLIHRPLLDGTGTPETHAADQTSDAAEIARAAAIAWFDEKIQTHGHAVITAPGCVVDQAAPRAAEPDTWVVLLDDLGKPPERVTTAHDTEHDTGRPLDARPLCNVRIDTADHDIDRIVTEIAAEWERVNRSTERPVRR